MLLRVCLLVFLFCSSTTLASDGNSRTGQQTAKKVEALIDQLREVANPDFGYSTCVEGTIFLPLEREGQHYGGKVLLAGSWTEPPLRRSAALRDLVRIGLPAVPHLLDHLDDKRPTQIPPYLFLDGWPGMRFHNSCDYNERTQQAPAARKDENAPQPVMQPYHRPTVGDLCAVALGQIVNRSFDAIAYDPVFRVILVSSPTRSPGLRDAIRHYCGDLTPEKHKASLLADFTKPDREMRRLGAAKRLAYYYPDALEAPVLGLFEFLPGERSETKDFTLKQLYLGKTPKERKDLFDGYIAKTGAPGRKRLLLQLFDDLNTVEAQERLGLTRALADFGDLPRSCLVELYGKKRSVKSEERPGFPQAPSAAEWPRFIREALIHDPSEKLDRAVRDMLASDKDDDALAVACMARLVGRGYDKDIERYYQERAARGSLALMLGKMGWTRLHVAAERGRTDEIERLIRFGADPNATNQEGQTPLHLAAESGDSQCARLLLDAKARPDAKDRRGETPVRLAILNGHWEVVRCLIEHGAAVPDILVAAALGKDGLVRGFLKDDPRCVRSRDYRGRTALHIAASQGYVAVVEALLAAKAPVEDYDYDGATPLHGAVCGGHDAVVRLLLAHGAGVRTPSRGEGGEPLHFAALTGHRKVVQVLLDHKADVGARGACNGMTALHLAAARGHTTVVELLLARGASVGTTDEGGWTPLHLAVAAGQRETVAVLLRHRADPTAKAKNEFKKTPLDIAKENGEDPILKLLRETTGSKE